eukprot:TCONS_00013932-protein
MGTYDNSSVNMSDIANDITSVLVENTSSITGDFEDISTKVQLTIYYIGIIGNIVIMIYFVCVSRKNIFKMSAYHFLLVLLAFEDFNMCLWLLLSKYQYNWSMTVLYCRFGSAILEVSSLAAIWALVLLFYERYKGIVYPFKRKLNKKKYFGLTLLYTILSWMLYIPEYFEVKVDKFERCVLKKSYTKIEFHCLLIYYRLFDTILPTALMFYFQRKISNYVKRISMTIRTTDNSRNHQNSRQNRNNIALKTLTHLLGFYTFLIVPWKILYNVALYLIYFEEELVIKHNLQILQSATCVFALNNIINVFVYLYLIKDFRKFLVSIVNCNLFCQRKLESNERRIQ